MKEKNIKQRIASYLEGTASPEERRVIEKHFIDYLDKSEFNPTDAQLDRSYLQGHQFLKDHISDERQLYRRIRKLMPYAAAVVAVFILVGGFFFLRQDKTLDNTAQVSNVTADSLPSGGSVTLTLTNGKTITLDSGQSGVVMIGEHMVYRDGSDIQHGKTGEDIGEERDYILQTPQGSIYQLQLPDGTQVWLNAASKITYSNKFLHKAQRMVYLEGEAYFEVAKQKDKPFIVQTLQQEIEVLGTHFNLDAYTDNTYASTTLAEGAVKVRDKKSDKFIHLTPGQQATSTATGTFFARGVDVYDYLAWRDGLYIVKNQSLKLLTKKLERWYGVTFDLNGYGEETISGFIQNKANLSEVLQGLQVNTGLQFSRSERNITVTKTK